MFTGENGRPVKVFFRLTAMIIALLLLVSCGGKLLPVRKE